MGLKEEIRSVTYLKSKAADLLEQVNETHRPVVITQNGEPRGVLVDPESFDRLRSAVGLLKLVAQGDVSVEAGRVRSQKAVFDDLEGKLLAMKADAASDDAA
jgi:prevent-host-death family protein